MGGADVIPIALSFDEEKTPIDDDVDGRKKKRKRINKRRYSGVEVRTLEEKVRDDDECCILSYDPTFQPTEKPPMDPRRQEDEISIIAQRGQVACRDYPHSRHLCVEYPFNKAHHESYCDQCYCYICDVVAPCEDWNGASGHCHASDQDAKWKAMKRARRQVPA